MVSLLWAMTLQSSLAASSPTFGEFFGINTHTIQFRPDLYKGVGRHVRNYHPVDWDVAGDPANPPVFPKTRNGMDWQAIYEPWHKGGWTTIASLMFESVPKPWSSSQAEAYGAAFGAAFGPEPWIEAVEIGNEPGKVSDSDYSMIFGSMAKGIKRTAPRIKTASCAVRVGPSGDYHKSVDTLLPHLKLVDALSIHTYSELEPWPTFKRSFPEDPKAVFLQPVKDLITWRDKHLPGKPIWVTEFGWDASTKQPDPNSDWAKWAGNTDQQQADWLARGALELWRLGVDRAYQFWFNDEDQPSMHGSSGLTRNYQPKTSFYALQSLMSELRGWKYEADLMRQEAKAYAIQLAPPAGRAGRKWVAWVPTREGAPAKVTLPLGAKKGAGITAFTLATSPASPKPVKLSPAPDGTVTVTISGTPTVISAE